jgi:hypothetical protein
MLPSIDFVAMRVIKIVLHQEDMYTSRSTSSYSIELHRNLILLDGGVVGDISGTSLTVTDDNPQKKDVITSNSQHTAHIC